MLRDGSYFLYATLFLSFTFYLYTIYFKHPQGEGQKTLAFTFYKH